MPWNNMTDFNTSLRSWIGDFIDHQNELRCLENNIQRIENEIRWEENRIATKKIRNKQLVHYKHELRKRQIELAFMYDSYYKLKGVQ